MTELYNASRAPVEKTMDRRSAVQGLMDHPQYLELRSDDRLTIIRKVQNGMPLSTMLLLLTAQHWVLTGSLIKRKGNGTYD
jgi:hypothetical protein